MKKENTPLTEFLCWAAIAGNILLVLWVSYNGIKAIGAGIKAPLAEIISVIGLMGILTLNTILILRGSRKKAIITTKGMEEQKTSLTEILSRVAIAGNILFMLWMTYRRIDESFKGSIYQQISYIGLIGLLSVTIFLLHSFRIRQVSK